MWQGKVFTPAAARAGSSGLVPYDLRHVFASQRIAEGLDILNLAAQLGHNPTMTLMVYGTCSVKLARLPTVQRLNP